MSSWKTTTGLFLSICVLIGCSEKGADQLSDALRAATTEEDASRSQQTVAPDPEANFDQKIESIVQQKSDGLHVETYPVDDTMLRQLSQTPTLTTVLIDKGIVTDDGIESIAQLAKLRHLRLRHSPITDVGLAKIAECKGLMFLNLPQVACTTDGIAKLSAIPDLRNLRLGASPGGKGLDNSVCQAIAKIESLTSVHLIGVPVDDDGLRQLASLPNLQSLYLDDSQVTDAGWDWLFKKSPDLHVHADQAHHDRDPHQHE